MEPILIFCVIIWLWLILADNSHNRQSIPADKFLEFLRKEPDALVFYDEHNPPKLWFVPAIRGHNYRTYIKGFYLSTFSQEPLALPDHCTCHPYKGAFQESWELLKKIGSRLYQYVPFWKKKS